MKLIGQVAADRRSGWSAFAGWRVYAARMAFTTGDRHLGGASSAIEASAYGKHAGVDDGTPLFLI